MEDLRSFIDEIGVYIAPLGPGPLKTLLDGTPHQPWTVEEY